MAKQTFTTGQVLTAAQMTSLQQTAMGGGSATAKTASYVLVAADAGATVIMNSASATTITVNTSLFSAGDTVFIQNIGAGISTITAGTATVNTSSSLALAQYDSGVLYFTATGASIFSKSDGASAGGGGKVLQYKMFQHSTGVTNSTTTYSNSNLTLAITPTLNTSKILIFVSQPYQKGADAGYAGDIALFRDSTSLTSNGFLGYVELANANMVTTHSINYLDSPATTSEITYRTKLRSSTTKPFTTCAGDSPAQITLLEMGA